MFDTSRIAGSDGTSDCLIGSHGLLYIYNPKTRRLPEDLYLKPHRYCRRSTLLDEQHIPLSKNLRMTNHTVFTFDDLRSINITHRELYKWYAPMDIIEDYLSGEQTGFFVNCSDPLWFGSTCEYTFDLDESLRDLIRGRFDAKGTLPIDLSSFTNGTCYEISNATCESILCLDWREICDGKIDCKNGFDEQYCQELEMNKCDPSKEHRCYDGQCVDSIHNIDKMQIECSEQYRSQTHSLGRCYEKPTEECENQKCASLLFSCGDGYCYDGPSNGSASCHTQRDQRYLQKMSPLSSLILFSHVHLSYNDVQPESICYNQTLCPYFFSNHPTMTTYLVDGLTCYSFETFSNQTYTEFSEMVTSMKRLLRSCSLFPFSYNHSHHTCPMYQCNDRSKCISFHRLSDGFEDCLNGDDEQQNNVCSLNLPDRFSCDNGTKCISQRLVYDSIAHCNDGTDESMNQAALVMCTDPFAKNCSFYTEGMWFYRLRFDHICNGVLEFIPDVNNNTDETDCLTTEWPCERYESKCNQMWNCPDGRDELGCNTMTLASLYCKNIEYFCIDIISGDNICLPTKNINDAIIHCVGSTDEREFCRNKYPYELFRRYHCRNSTICISFYSICDCQQDCPENDDETIACTWFNNGESSSYKCLDIDLCYLKRDEEFDGRDDLFCDLVDERSNNFWKYNQIEEFPLHIVQNDFIRTLSQNLDPSVVWSCNRGIYVRSIKDSSGFVCLCPEYYYGDRCQYQRKRIKLIFQMQMNSSFNHQISTFKFIVLLAHENKTSTTILSHDQFTYIPRYSCLPKFYIPLVYPIKEPYRFFNNNSIQIHAFDGATLEHRYSWNFLLSFEFLPVQTIVKRLSVPEMVTHDGSRQISPSYTGCSSCSNTSRCLGHDVSLARDICVCSSNYIGRRCLIPFDPCTNRSCNGHGKCQPLGIDRYLYTQFECSCELGWYGEQCENPAARIHVFLARDLRYLSSHVVFLHIIDPYNFLNDHVQNIYFHRFHKEIFNLTFIINDTETILNGGFIQFYEHQYKFDYYYLFLRKLNQRPFKEILVELQLSHRCRPVHELFDADILAQPAIRRVKNYQKPCRQHQISCFYDDTLMCVCGDDNQSSCFTFQTQLDTCDNIWCNNRGVCVQDHLICPVYSQCICHPCAYGRFCQVSTGGYTLSLDGIIGSHILMTATSLSEQPSVIRFSMGIIIVIVLFGIILNVLSICTFVQKETQEVGCGFYLLTSSIMGLLSAMILMCKSILLLTGERSNVACSLVEFLLRWCPASCQWLNAGVAVERSIAVKRKTQYSRATSKRVSTWMVPAILIFVGLMTMPELFFRRIIIDPLDERAWCVLTRVSDRSELLAVYSALNILSFLVPLASNLSSAIIIISGTFQSKKKTNKNQQVGMNGNTPWRIRLKAIRNEILQHKHILITPLLLAILSLPNIILTFIFVCTKLDQNSISSLIAYLVAFLPTMTIPFAFVWPSQIYRTVFLATLKKIVP